MSIYISGSLAFDRVMNFPGSFSEYILPDKIHMLNVCFPIGNMDEMRGGTGGNIAYALALLGEKATILASVGKDFGPYRSFLQDAGLPLDGINTVPGAFTAGAYITTDKYSNQITGFHAAAMQFECGFAFPELDPARDFAIIAPTNIRDMAAHVKLYSEHGLRYIYDPGQQITSLNGAELLEGIGGAFMLVSNDYELELICKITGKDQNELLELAGTIITTLGEKGSRLNRQGRESVSIPSVRIDRLADPTGAGDCFRAGLIKSIMHGLELEEAIRLASTCASFCVEHYGTQSYLFDHRTLEARFQAAYGHPLPLDVKSIIPEQYRTTEVQP